MVTVSYVHFHVWLFLSISFFSITLGNLRLIAKDIVCNLQVATQWPVYPIKVHKIFPFVSTFFFWVKHIKGILTDVEWRALSKFSKFEFFAYFFSSPLRSTLSQRNWAEIISVWNESNFHRKSRTREFIQHSSLWEQWNTHNHAKLKNVKLESTEILEISFFFVYILWFMP